jgi:hypothetical protein
MWLDATAAVRQTGAIGWNCTALSKGVYRLNRREPLPVGRIESTDNVKK